MTQCCPGSRALLLAAVVWIGAGGAASAQVSDQQLPASGSLADVKTRVPAGDVVFVTDTTGATTKGTLVAVKDDAVQVRIKGEARTVTAASIRRLDWQPRDSTLTGVLIGAGIGAIPGIYWLIADPNECTGLCPEDYVAIAVGGLVGGLIDRAIKKTVTVYSVGAPSSRASVAIAPVLSQGRKGIRVAVRF